MRWGSASRSWTRWTGIGLALVGLALISWAAWQYWGTTWVSRAHQQQIVEQLEKNWAELPPKEPQPLNPAGSPAPEPSAAVETGGTIAGAILRIPAFGSDYAVPILEGTSSDILSLGVGHFEDSAPVGGVGNYALAAHRITHGEPFRNMPDLVAGDQVIIDTARWRYTYVLDTDGDGLEVGLHDTWVTDPVPHNPLGGVGPLPGSDLRLITLTTCAELFHTDDRLVAFGHLVERTER